MVFVNTVFHYHDLVARVAVFFPLQFFFLQTSSDNFTDKGDLLYFYIRLWRTWNKVVSKSSSTI